MTDIKAELDGWLKAASDRYEEARHEVELVDGLIAEFTRLTAGDTRAFPAVPIRPADVEPPFVSWDALVGGRVVVTLTNGNVYDGVLESLGGGKAKVRGWEGESSVGPAFLPLEEVESIRPVVAPVPQGVALADIQPGVTYLDRTGDAWSLFRDDGVMPMLVNGEFLHMPADQLIGERGPLGVAPDPEITRPDETPDGADHA